MSHDCRVVIERVANGYEVEVSDPAISKGKGDLYVDRRKEYVFKSIDEVLSFLTKNLDKALPADEYDSAFDEAVEEDDE
jgi:hypothetical protein